MNLILDIVILALNILLLVTLAHWALSLFRESAGADLRQVIAALDRFMEPVLERIRVYVHPLQMDRGRMLDLAHLVLIILIVLAKYVARAIFG